MLGLANQFKQTLPQIQLGTGAEVSEHLRQTAFPPALVITFEDNDESVAYEELLRRMSTFLPQLIRQRQNNRLEIIVEALLPKVGSIMG